MILRGRITVGILAKPNKQRMKRGEAFLPFRLFMVEYLRSETGFFCGNFEFLPDHRT